MEECITYHVYPASRITGEGPYIAVSAHPLREQPELPYAADAIIVKKNDMFWALRLRRDLSHETVNPPPTFSPFVFSSRHTILATARTSLRVKA